jgi:putative endonuclease
MKQGFRVVFRNYLKKWGEIDIVASKGEKTCFIEVKSVSCESFSHETCGKNPAEGVHEKKLHRMKRAIESYILEFDVRSELEIQVLSVHISSERKEAFVEWLYDEIP